MTSQPARQEKLFSLFFQDDIRLTEKLKMNLGLRWDYLGPLTDRFNELPRGFAATTLNPHQRARLPGVRRRAVCRRRTATRAASSIPHGATSGRAWGRRISSTTTPCCAAATRWSTGRHSTIPATRPASRQTTNMVTSIQAGVPANTLDNPFPTGILQPAGSSQGLLTALGQSYTFADPAGGAPPYVHQFSFEIQRELARRFAGRRRAMSAAVPRALPVTQQLNALPIGSLALGTAALSQSVPNPFAGLLPGTSLNGATIQQQQLLAPYPEFLMNGITENFRPIGKSSYNSVQFLVTKRLSYGLNFSVAYTISKQIDQTNFANPQDNRLERVVAAWDIPQNLQINFLYELPFGTGKRFGASLASAGPLGRQRLGGQHARRGCRRACR